MLGMSVANQIRKGQGVNMGGAQGRLNSVHKGVGLSAFSGGLNAKGSGKKVVPPRRPAPMLGGHALAKPAPVKPKPATNLFGHSVPAKASPVLPGNRAVAPAGKKFQMDPATGKYKLIAAPGTGIAPAPTVAAAPTPAAAPNLPKPTGLDYTGLSSYTLGMAGVNQEFGAARQDAQLEYDRAHSQYDPTLRELKESYQESVDTGVDQESNAGLLRSGHREKLDADRFEQFNSHMKEVEDQFGSGATARLNAALARLADQEKLARQQVEDQAHQQWDDIYAPAPIYEDEPVAAVEEFASEAPAAGPKAKAKAPAGMAYVKGPTGYKLVTAPAKGVSKKAGPVVQPRKSSAAVSFAGHKAAPAPAPKPKAKAPVVQPKPKKK